MTCLDCKHCDVKDKIDYYWINNETFVELRCNKNIYTKEINVDYPEEICCKDFEVEEIENESS